MTAQAVLFVALLLTPQPPSSRPTPAGHQDSKPPAQRPHQAATHATKGVIKTVSATSLVITRRMAGTRTDTAFVLTPSTQRVGTLVAGATAEIRYRTEGKQRVATAVSVEDPVQ